MTTIELIGTPPSTGRTPRKPLSKMSSLAKVMSFYDAEANFHGDKQTLYDPNEKFSKLGEDFWRLDFKLSALKRWPVYRENLKFLFGLGGEVIAVGGSGALYIYPHLFAYVNEIISYIFLAFFSRISLIFFYMGIGFNSIYPP